MSAPSSPEVLKALWDKYAASYKKTFRHDLSKKHFCERMDWEPNVLSKWMMLDTPNNRRIPLKRIRELAIALGTSDWDTDRLMKARLRELCEQDDSLKEAVLWTKQQTEKRASHRYHLANDEKDLLAVYRAVKDEYPLGLTGEEDEALRLAAVLHEELARAAAVLGPRLAAEAEEIACEAASSSESTPQEAAFERRAVEAMLRQPKHPDVYQQNIAKAKGMVAKRASAKVAR